MNATPPSPAQQAFYPRYARWCVAAVEREIGSDYPILRAFATSQSANEPAPRFLRALQDVGRKRAAELWRAHNLVMLSRWGLSAEHARTTSEIVGLQAEFEALVQRPPPSYAITSSPARARTAFMKRVALEVHEFTGASLDRLGAGEWQSVTQRGAMRVVLHFDTGSRDCALHFEYDIYDVRHGCLMRRLSPLSTLSVTGLTEWGRVEDDDGLPIVAALRISLADVLDSGPQLLG